MKRLPIIARLRREMLAESSVASVQHLEPRRLLAALVSEAVLQDDFSGSSLNNANFYVPAFDPKGSTFFGDTQLQVSPTYSPPVSDGALHLTLNTYNPTASTPGDSFFGSEVISQRQFSVGQGLIVDVRARVPAGTPAGIVSAPFLYSPPGASGNHDEIDFELLTNNTSQVLTNVYANQPLGVGSPVAVDLPSGSLSDYHDYQIMWLPNEVQWSVDGQVVRTETDTVPAGPMSLYLNTYVPSSDFAAAYNPDLHPATLAADNQVYDFDVESVSVTQLTGAAMLAFANQPSDATAGAVISPPITVDVEGPGGQLLSGDKSDVSLAVAGGPGGANLAGTTTVAAVNGVATFSDLSITTPGENYTLTATDGTLPSATSTPFGIVGAPLEAAFGNVSLPPAVVAGAKFRASVPVVVTNSGGDFRGAISIDLYADTGSSLDGSQVFVTSLKKNVSLRAGSVKSFNVTVRSLPATLADGAYHLLAEVTGPSGTASVAATAQSVEVAAPFIQPGATVGPVIPASIAPGKSGSILVSVTNNGNVAAKGVTIMLSLSADGVTPIPGVVLAKARSGATIQPNKSKGFRLRFKVTTALAAGAYLPYVSLALGGELTTAVGMTPFTVE